jgi:hypothetical protein
VALSHPTVRAMVRCLRAESSQYRGNDGRARHVRRLFDGASLGHQGGATVRKDISQGRRRMLAAGAADRPDGLGISEVVETIAAA